MPSPLSRRARGLLYCRLPAGREVMASAGGISTAPPVLQDAGHEPVEQSSHQPRRPPGQ